MLTSEGKIKYQIGGEFELSVEDFLRQETNITFNRPQKENYLHLDTGRSAIYMALLSIIRQGGKREAWLPRYCCSSILLPFKKLGFKLHFYSSGKELSSPCYLPDHLDRQTFLFIHYFGKKNTPILDYLEQMKKQHSFFVIEDCVQALLNEKIGTCDYVIYSFRKFMPLPDGALLASDFPLYSETLSSANEAFISRKLIGKMVRGEGDEGLFLSLFEQAETIIDDSICPREMSWVSCYLLARTNPALINAKRRENFFSLTQLLQNFTLDFDLIHPLFNLLEDYEVPLGLPVVVDPRYRDKLHHFLSNQKIYCPIHWPLPIKPGLVWETEMLLSRSLITLPIDQRLDPHALVYMAHRIYEFFQNIRRAGSF